MFASAPATCGHSSRKTASLGRRFAGASAAEDEEVEGAGQERGPLVTAEVAGRDEGVGVDAGGHTEGGGLPDGDLVAAAGDVTDRYRPGLGPLGARRPTVGAPPGS